MKYPTVAIIGRPNVGKSSLFNRFLRRQHAVVAEQPGVTRDRNYAVCEWSGRSFYLIDTGGIVADAEELMEQLIYDQTEFAMAEADNPTTAAGTPKDPEGLPPPRKPQAASSPRISSIFLSKNST